MKKLITIATGLALALVLALTFAPGAQAQDPTSSILLPVDGSDLCVGDIISWSTDAGVTGVYRLRIGSEPNGNDILNNTYPEVVGLNTPVLSDMVPMLPEGEDVYVSLRYRVGTEWVFQDAAVYTACDSEVIIQSDFADICEGDVLAWNPVTAGGKYRLRIGMAPDGFELLNQSTAGTEIAVEFGDLSEGDAVYATLRYKPAGGSWIIVDERTFLPCVGPINITAPITELCTGDLIVWPAIGKAQIRLGTAPDTRDIWTGTTWGNSLAAPILPPDIPIHASLRGQNAEGRWVLYDIVEFAPCSNPIDLDGPVGPTLCSSDALTWTGDADRFRIWIGTTPGGNDLFNTTARENEVVAELLPPDGDRYVTLLAKSDGVWTTQSEVEYDACEFSIELTSDNGFTEVCPGDAMSTSGPTTGDSRLWIGTAVGESDLLSISIPPGASFTIPEANVSGPGDNVYLSVVHRPDGKDWAIHEQTVWEACKAVPTARNDSPAPGSVAGDDHHLAPGESRDIEVGDSENLLDNDTLGQPYAVITAFNSVVVTTEAGTTVLFGGDGSIVVQADGTYSVIAPTSAGGSITFAYVLTNPEGTSTADLTLKWGDA